MSRSGGHLLVESLIAQGVDTCFGVPGESSTTAFWAIIGFMSALLVAMVVFFRRRGWL